MDTDPADLKVLQRATAPARRPRSTLDLQAVNTNMPVSQYWCVPFNHDVDWRATLLAGISWTFLPIPPDGLRNYRVACQAWHINGFV